MTLTGRKEESHEKTGQFYPLRHPSTNIHAITGIQSRDQTDDCLRLLDCINVTVSHLEALGFFLLLMDRDNNEADEERQAEDHNQQDETPRRQIQVTLSKNNH